MAHARSVARRCFALLCTAGLGAGGLVALPGSAAAAPATAPGHDRLVTTVPKAETPDVQDGLVATIYDAGDKIIAGGSFGKVRSTGATKSDVRVNIFAFDEATGVVDKAFNPAVVDGDGNPGGEVTTIIGGPTPDTVYVAGRFANIASADPKRKNLALLNVADGSIVSTFRAPSFNGAVTDLKLVGNRLLVGGNFTTAGGAARGGLASLDPTTGALTDYLTVTLTENHSWTEGSTNAKAAVGVENIAVSPDGSQLVVIGNFKKANGESHDQIVKIDLDGSAATIANWDTERFRAVCAPTSFDSFVRDVAFSPDGSYFVVVSTGAYNAGTVCDGAARFNANTTGPGQEPVWIASTGGDTVLSVAISEQAVYIGGHMRWTNNPLGNNVAKPGAVTRPSLAALDPANGLPLAWNPGRHPRGYGVDEIYLTPDGMWIGHDQEWIGNQEYKHDRIAFFPLSGGAVPAGGSSKTLPGNVYAFGKDRPTEVLARWNVGGEAVVARDGGPNWQADSPTAPSRYHNLDLNATDGGYWIPNTLATVRPAVPREIFNSQRTTSASQSVQRWFIPVAKGTTVTVRLYFAIRCVCSAGRRVFNLNIDGVRKLTNFDIITAAGGYEVGMMRAFNVTSDGRLDIDMIRVKGDSPLNAIEIARNPVPALTGAESKMYRYSFDGGTSFGSRVEIPNTPNFPWEGTQGAFVAGNTMFIFHASHIYRRTWDGTDWGPLVTTNPYSDAKWDAVVTYSGPLGQTYAGSKVEFYHEKPIVSGMFYEDGWMYYTLAGHPTLYRRAFSTDSAVIGAERQSVASSVDFSDAHGVFVSDGKLYLVARSTGNITRLDWSNGVPSGTPVTVGGPTVNGVDWRAEALFVGP